MAYTNEQRTAYYQGRNAAWNDIECNEKTVCTLSDSVLINEWRTGYNDARREENLSNCTEWDHD